MKDSHMHDTKLIKKIFNLAHYDLMQNKTAWLWAINSITIIIGLLTYFNLFLLTSLISSICSLIIIKNCLDLAFDSAMSRLNIRFDLLNILVTISTIIMILCVSNYNFLDIFESHYLNIMTSIIEICTLFYCVVCYNLLVMHILEYKKSLLVSVQDIFKLVTHNHTKLLKLLFLQFSRLTIIAILLMIIEAFLSLIIPIGLTNILIHYLYIFSSLFIYIWMNLIWAHFYRQMICPPVENPTCQSCNSCSK